MRDRTLTNLREAPGRQAPVRRSLGAVGPVLGFYEQVELAGVGHVVTRASCKES